MAKLGFEFQGDIDELNNNDFDRKPLPDGEYLALISDADYKATKSGNGFYVSVTLDVIDGEHANRKVWANLNIINPNEQAQSIGQQQMAKLCLAVLGKPSCDDTDELIGSQVVIGVGIDKNDPTRNRVKYFNPVDAAPAPKPVAKPAAAPASTSAKPWARGK